MFKPFGKQLLLEILEHLPYKVASTKDAQQADNVISTYRYHDWEGGIDNYFLRDGFFGKKLNKVDLCGIHIYMVE